MAWRRNSHFIEITDDAVQRHTLISPVKNLFHDRSRLFVNQQLVTVIWVFPVAIRRPRTDIIAVFHSLPCLCLNFSANVQRIGFVYHVFQGEHNATVKVAWVCRVKLICDRNKTDIVRVKILFNIIAGINGIAPQPGKVFDDHTVDMARFNVRKHLLESGTVEIRPRQAVVDICVIDYKIRFIRQIIIQYQLLILHGTAAFLVILHRKPDIQCHIYI